MFTPTISLNESTARFINKLHEIDPRLKIGLIKRAYKFSWNAHQHQLRKSGEPFLAHPVAVAFILAEQQLDPVTIAAGLLHDVLEDTSVSLDILKENFGEEVALLVDGVTKIESIQVKSQQQQQVESYRKLLLSMARDLRVIIIKFADRLHNLRTLKYLLPEKIQAITTETLDIYAPLAHRLGMARIKWELEDLSFKYLHPKEYNEIVSRIVSSRYEREKIIDSFAIPLRRKLESEGIKTTVIGRPKHFYSIYRKMIERNKPFEEIYDLLALRVITNTNLECYQALGIIHSLWNPIQDRFKDYISIPKSNGYRSLHTTVVGLNGHITEMQIRTWEMDQVAEDGIAAHWLYKDGKVATISQDDRALVWLKNLIEWQKELTDSSEFYEYFKVELFHAEVFIFTPKGDLITLPKGATVLDFAFAVHTDLGLHCIGARVDGKIETVNKVLKSGNTVEILHLSSKKPALDWLRDVKTPKARSAIKRWLRSTARQESIELGKNILKASLRKYHLTIQLSDHISPLLEFLGLNSEDTLHELIGKGDLPISRVMAYFMTNSKNKGVGSRVSRFVDSLTGRNRKVLVVGSTDNLMIRYARCCNPVPGDDIIGFVTKGRGIAVHRNDCQHVDIFRNDEERVISVSWEGEQQQTQKFFVTLEITGRYTKELMHSITTVLLKTNAEITGCSYSMENQHVRLILLVTITDKTQLRQILRNLTSIKGIEKVTRMREKNQSTEDASH